MFRLAVLVSGSGTILEAIIEQRIPVGLVVADRPCRGLDVAERASVPFELVSRTDFSRSFDRVQYTEQLVSRLLHHRIDLVAMAGFMTILAEPAFVRFPGRVLNTHPSLLPSFKGAHAVRDALASGHGQTGCTVHVATADLDAGPILAQQAVPILPNDDQAILHERIKLAERQLYPKVISEILSGNLVVAETPPKKQAV